MIEVVIGSGDTTTITPPTLNDGSLEALDSILSYELACTIRNLRRNGYTISQAVSSDVSDAETAINSLIDYTKSWQDSAINASVEGNTPTAYDKSYIPEILSFAGLALSGQWGLIFVLFVKVGLEYLLDTTEKKLDPDVSTGDQAEILKQLFGVLDEDGNIVASKIEGLTQLKIQIKNYLSEQEQEGLWSSNS